MAIEDRDDLPFDGDSAEEMWAGMDETTADRAADGTLHQPASNLAALLDRFSASISEPEAHTIGSFAETVQALHAELAMLARHFGAVADRTAGSAGHAIEAVTTGDAQSINEAPAIAADTPPSR